MRRIVVIAALVGLTVTSVATAASYQSSSSLIVFGGTGAGNEIPLSFEIRDSPARLTGRLVVRFHGDRATGCAARGLCGYSGTMIWTPGHSGMIEIDGITTRKGTGYSADLEINFFNFDGNSGGITDEVTSGQAATCADAAETGSDLALPIAHGRVRMELTETDPNLFQTRCAGPLQRDLASALPSTTLPFSTLMHGETSVPLGGDHRFAASGFAGTVNSTLSVSLGKPGAWQRSKPHISTRTERQVTIAYRATLSGEIVAAVSGDADAGLCGPLGACGARGTMSLRPRPVGEADVTAVGSRKSSSAQLLRALRSGRPPKGVELYGYMTWHGGGMLAAAMRTAGGTCSDHTGLSGAQGILRIGRRALAVQFSIGNGYSGGELRTRCPGPFAPERALATGHAPSSIIGRATATIPLRAAFAFHDDGYMGHMSSTLKITLSHRRVERGRSSELTTIAG